jgi:sporulation protein YlmC with PRC-barrel domain
VVTESGEQLGRVLGFSFDIETGELTTLVIGALGVPLLGEGVLSTWEMPVGEIVSSGSDRIIVYEGAEEKLKQLGTGLLEKLGIGGGSLEQEERERYRTGVVPAENQLAAGQPSAVEQRRIEPASSRSFQPQNELEYVELEERREREPLRQRRYLDEDDQGRRPPLPRETPPPQEYVGSYRSPEERFAEERFPEDRYPQERFPEDRYPQERFPEEQYREERNSEVRNSEGRSPARQPLRAEPREARRDREPIDVEPEVLDDPW